MPGLLKALFGARQELETFHEKSSLTPLAGSLPAKEAKQATISGEKFSVQRTETAAAVVDHKLREPQSCDSTCPRTCAPSCYEIEPGCWIHHPWDGCTTPVPIAENNEAQEEQACWHCGGEGACQCIACREGGRSLAGICVVCRGTKKTRSRLQ
jgi:hypothetical protein